MNHSTEMNSTDMNNATAFATNWYNAGALRLKAPLAELLKYWEKERLITALDRHFALEMARLHPNDAQEPLFMLLCALLSQQLSAQHTCLVLEYIVPTNPMAESVNRCQIRLSLAELIETLQHFDAIGAPNSNKPLIFEDGRLYLERYHHFEAEVASALTRLSATAQSLTPSQPLASDNQVLSPSCNEQLRRQLDCLFPSTAHTVEANIDWQKVATATALGNKLAVITGGPGTGKTTTVTKLLLLQQLGTPKQIRLVAPTGKAAARLSESIKASKARLEQELQQASKENPQENQVLLTALSRIPEEASTLHRLLGVIPNSAHFRHHQGNPLRLDLLIVDEASMVDLPMMYKLLSALPEHAGLILLGDQDQLASVEAGAVLADICAGLKQASMQHTEWKMRYSQAQAEQLTALTGFNLTPFIHGEPKIGDSLCMLTHSHRFKGDAGIGLLASAVNRADLVGILSVWQRGLAELTWFEHSVEHSQTQAKISEPSNNTGLKSLLLQACEQYGDYLRLLQPTHANPIHTSESFCPPSAMEAIAKFNQYRILCAMRTGDYGVEGINLAVTKALAQAKLIQPQQEFYLGRPIIIQSNDYNLGLFNGDIGLILQDEERADRLMAHFIKADGKLLKVLPARLPSHETCYAMTVHKSQGSEFNRVALVLPPSPSLVQWQLLTKELIYTAITRAKQHFSCLGTQQVFERASLQATQRASGLADRLWGEQSLSHTAAVNS